MRTFAASLAILGFAATWSLAAVAQTASAAVPADSQPKLTLHPPITILLGAVGNRCPVGFNATRAGMPVMRSVASRRVLRDGPMVDVSLISPVAQPIAEVKIVVHGISAQPRLVPAYASSADDIAEVFHLRRASGTTELHLRQSGVVSRVEITEIQFADGTMWHPSDDSRCSVTPSLFVPVNASAR